MHCYKIVCVLLKSYAFHSLYIITVSNKLCKYIDPFHFMVQLLEQRASVLYFEVLKKGTYYVHLAVNGSQNICFIIL